jgi:hypothetical protein
MQRTTWRRAMRAAGAMWLLLGMVASSNAPAAEGRARRTDHGALIVIDLHGSYEAMGRQQVELLVPETRELGELYGDRWNGLVRSQGFLGRFVNGLVLPVWTTFGGWREDSGLFEETAGIARALAAR